MPPLGRILFFYYNKYAKSVKHKNFTNSVGVPGIEPESHAPEACILPLYYTPKTYCTIHYNSLDNKNQFDILTT
jgi:hypothetical protein